MIIMDNIAVKILPHLLLGGNLHIALILHVVIAHLTLIHIPPESPPVNWLIIIVRVLINFHI